MSDPRERDLRLRRRTIDEQTSDRDTVDLRTWRADLATVDGVENLAQAIINRLLTRRGELAVFGHDDYGSRLYLLVGELNNRRTRLLAEAYIREALADEPRVAEVIAVEAAAPSRGVDRDTLYLSVSVRPAGRLDALTLGLSLSLGG